MSNKRSSGNGMIAAERRLKIYNWALENGSVNVTALAEMLGVGPDTIRRDLDELDREGKVVRSHGGAIVKETGAVRPSYSQTRNERSCEKSWIGRVAIDYLPPTGSIFIGGGTTIAQFAMRIPEVHPVSATTTSPEIAFDLTVNKHVQVGLLGGQLRSDAYTTDGSLSEEALEMLLWDVAFIGVSAIDIRNGITSIDRKAALLERKIIEHSSKVVVLCDSSKLGRLSYAKVGPVSLIDVLITDNNANPGFVDELNVRGVQVVLAEPDVDSSEG
ncbi:MAG: DeoR/GlpR family DNA-binding transcription regulator [Armatimonadota bacterium]|nr:DeoR/GlpR family DNA-binding transcription regulator [bacterium]